MTYEINETHDPNLRSWVESANDPETDFPIQNLPFTLFNFVDRDRERSLFNVGIAIGDKILNLNRFHEEKLIGDLKAGYFLNHPHIDNLGSLFLEERQALRKCFSDLLSNGATKEIRDRVARHLLDR